MQRTVTKPTEPTMIQREIDLHLTDIYGGDGFERPETVKEVTLEESKTTITVRKDVGVPVEKERERKQVKEKEISVFTFKRDDDGAPMYRLGGTHGKLWGCMKEAGVLLYQMGEQQNKVTTERIMKAVQIQPQWVRLEMPENVEMTQDTLPQELQGRNSAMVEHHYDVVPEANVSVTITHPEAFGEKVEEYLEHAQTINFGNKRRGTLEIVNQDISEI